MYRNLLGIDDIKRAVKEIQDIIKPVFSKTIDFGKRRITNAHPSINDYDYVVRKELKKAVEDITINKTTGTAQRDQTVWLECVLPGARSVANDVMDSRIRIKIDPGMKLMLKGVYATVKTTPPTGDGYVANILRSNDSSATFTTIFSGTGDANRLKVAASAHRGEQLIFAIKEFLNDDELRLDEIKVNGAVAMHITVMMKLVKK